MLQTIGLKRFAVEHQVGTALVAGILLSSLLWVAGLGLTGSLPELHRGGSASVQSSAAPAAADVERAKVAAFWLTRFFGGLPHEASLQQLATTVPAWRIITPEQYATWQHRFIIPDPAAPATGTYGQETLEQFYRPVAALPLAHLSDGAGEGWVENGRP